MAGGDLSSVDPRKVRDDDDTYDDDDGIHAWNHHPSIHRSAWGGSVPHRASGCGYLLPLPREARFGTGRAMDGRSKGDGRRV